MMESFYPGDREDTHSRHSGPDGQRGTVVPPEVFALLDSLLGFSFYLLGCLLQIDPVFYTILYLISPSLGSLKRTLLPLVLAIVY
jgi:hypothetical protein